MHSFINLVGGFTAKNLNFRHFINPLTHGIIFYQFKIYNSKKKS